MQTQFPVSRSRRRSGLLVSLLLAVLALLLVAPGAGAWTIVNYTGVHGQWRFMDQVRHPGGICERRPEGVYIVSNDSATVWARDRSVWVDRQKVGAQFITQVRRDGRWVPVASVFGMSTDNATDATPATFAWGGDVFPRGACRIVLRFLWFARMARP